MQGSLQHLNTILERQWDNCVVGISQLLLVLATVADVALLGTWEKKSSSRQKRAGHSCSIQSDFSECLCIAPRCHCLTCRYIVRNWGHYAPLRPGQVQTICKKSANGTAQLVGYNINVRIRFTTSV